MYSQKSRRLRPNHEARLARPSVGKRGSVGASQSLARWKFNLVTLPYSGEGVRVSANKLTVLLCAVMACAEAAIAQPAWTAPAAPATGADLAEDATVLRATLENPMPNTLHFGSSVAIDGDTLAVGAPGYASAGIQLGGVAIYTRAGGAWVLQQTVTRAERDSSGPSSGLRLGERVALSGDTLVVNAYYVFVRNGGTWTQQAALIPNGRVSSLTDRDSAIAADVDGDIAVVSYSQGAVLAFARTGTVWTEQARLRSASSARLGDFDLDGETVLIGEPSETVGANSSQGAAHVFVRNGNVWTRQAVPDSPDGPRQLEFWRGPGAERGYRHRRTAGRLRVHPRRWNMG